MSDAQQLAKDVAAVTPYVWEAAAFFAVLGCSRVTQWLKQRRWFPMWMCTERTSKSGKYKKIKRRYLMPFFYCTSYGSIFYCLMQRYDNQEQIAVITAIITANIFVFMEWGLSRIEKSNPDLADTIANGLYRPDEEQTIFVKAATMFVGRGKPRPDVDFDLTGTHETDDKPVRK